MFPIEQSAFLQALGYAIGNSLWQVAAIWLLYAAATNLFTISAARKYQMAASGSFAGFIWFIATFIYSVVYATPASNHTTVYTFSDTAENLNRSSVISSLQYFYHSVLATLKSLSPYISCAYLLIFLILGIRLYNGFRQVKFFSSQGLAKVDVHWRMFVRNNAEILQIRKNVKVFSSKYVQSPLTMGFWKPIILLPVASLNSLSTHQVEAILLHELAHIRRHDYLINIFVQVAEVCLFFNPFMKLLLKQIKMERENSCDDYVLQFQYNAKDYAQALLTIEKNNAATLLALSANDNQSFQLLNRVKRMVAPQPHAFNYRQQLYMLLLLTILGLGFTVIVPKPKIKNPVAASGHLYKTPAGKESQNVNLHPQAPPAPAAFDLVKTIQGIRNFTENIDLKEIEAQGKELGEKAEALGKSYAAKVERSMQPYIDDCNEWANKFSENNAALAKLESATKELESLPENEKAFSLNHINEYIAPALQKLNEAFKTFPKINVEIPQFNIAGVAPPALPRTPVAEVTPMPRVFFRSPAPADRMRIMKEKTEMAAEMEKGKAEIKKAIEEARLDYRNQVEAATERQQKSIVVNSQMATHSRLMRLNTEARVNDLDSDDADDTDEGDNDGNGEKAALAKVSKRLKNGKAFTYTFKIPDIPQFENFEKNFHIDFGGLFNDNNSKAKKVSTERKIGTRNANEPDNLDNNDEDADDSSINSNDIKTIDIQKQKRTRNGREENVVVIRIIPSR